MPYIVLQLYFLILGVFFPPYPEVTSLTKFYLYHCDYFLAVF